MWEWLTTFWSNNWEFLLVTIISGIVVAVVSVFLTRLMIPNTEQQQRRHRDQFERLKAKLERHRRDQRDKSWAVARELFYFIAVTTLIGETVIILAIFTMDDVAALSQVSATGAPDSPEGGTLIVPFIGILAWLNVWVLIMGFISLPRLFRLLAPEGRDKRLVNRIKRIEPSWEDRKP